MGYNINGYGEVVAGSAYSTNSGLPYSERVASIAQAAANGTLSGFNSGYSIGGGCTWGASGRAASGGRNGAGGGNAADGWKTFGGSYGISASDVRIYNISAGDVLVFSGGTYGHVAYVEDIIYDTLGVSEGASGTYNYNVVMMSSHNLAQFVANQTHGFGSGDKLLGILKGTGTPPKPPEPEPQPGDNGHGEDTTWETTTIQIVTHQYAYSTIYECGVGTFGDQSGTQDEPLAPTKISQSTSRLNQRGEPFNMYTYERLLTYDSKKDPVWSGGDLKYQGFDNFPLGNQPSMNNGGQIDGEDGG